MSIALIYARSADGDTAQLVQQKVRAEKAAVNDGWETNNLIESGTADTNKIAEAIKSGRYGAIYATDPTRISRDTDEVQAIHKLARKHGVQINYIDTQLLSPDDTTLVSWTRIVRILEEAGLPKTRKFKQLNLSTPQASGELL